MNDPLTPEEIAAALRELRDAGGEMRYVHCTFGFHVTMYLTAEELVTLDTGPVLDAFVRLTAKGRQATDH